MKNYDVIIIGNGILGQSTALSLSELDPTLTILLIGPEHYANGASVAAGAMLGVFGEVTETTFKSEYALAKLHMGLASQTRWSDWLDQINGHLQPHEHVIITPGTHVILNSQASSRESHNFNAIIDGLNQYNGQYSEVNPETIKGLNPIDNQRPLRSLYLPDEGKINPYKLLNAIEKIGQQQQRWHECNALVTSIELGTQNEKIIHCKEGHRFTTNQVVIAAGAYSQEIIETLPELAAATPRLFAGVGSSLVLRHHGEKPEIIIRTPNRAGACGAHYLPFDSEDSLVYLGASNSLNLTPQQNTKLSNISYLMKWGMEQFDKNLFKAELIRINTGNRPVPIDTFPLIGKTHIDGVTLLTGTFRDGIHDSPLLAEMIAKDILFEETVFKHPFSPMRKPIQLYSVEQSIDEAVNHYMSAGYEHGMALPKMNWDSRLRTMLGLWIERLYEKLNIDFGLAPEIIMMLNQSEDSIPIIAKHIRSTR